MGTKNKDFWKTIKPIFSKTRTKSDNIPLSEGNQIITNCMEVCNIFNTFFREIGSEIGGIEDNTRNTEQIIADYANHSSVNTILENINHNRRKFDFRHVTEHEVRKAIKSLCANKAGGCDEIPIKFIKQTSENLIKPVTLIANKCIEQQKFPDNIISRTYFIF